MQIGRFRLGMRTIKTALAVMLCILLFHVTDRGSPLIAALAAVFSLRQDLTTSISFGRSRVLGNSLGGLLALIFYYIQAFFKNDFLIELFISPQTDEKEKQIKEDLVELRKKEADLNKMLYDVRKQIKDQTHK